MFLFCSKLQLFCGWYQSFQKVLDNERVRANNTIDYRKIKEQKTIKIILNLTKKKKIE